MKKRNVGNFAAVAVLTTTIVTVGSASIVESAHPPTTISQGDGSTSGSDRPEADSQRSPNHPVTDTAKSAEGAENTELQPIRDSNSPEELRVKLAEAEAALAEANRSVLMKDRLIEAATIKLQQQNEALSTDHRAMLQLNRQIEEMNARNAAMTAELDALKQQEAATRGVEDARKKADADAAAAEARARAEAAAQQAQRDEYARSHPNHPPRHGHDR